MAPDPVLMRFALPLIIIVVLPTALAACSTAPDAATAPTAPATTATTTSTADRLSAGALLAVTPVNSVAMLTVAPRRDRKSVV